MAYLNKITLYMKEEEHQLLKEKAKKSGMTMSAYVKKKCLGEGVDISNLFKRQK